MAKPLIIDPNDRDKRLALDPRTGRMSRVEINSELNDNLAAVYRRAYSAGSDLAAGYQASLSIVRPGDEVLEPAPVNPANPAAPEPAQKKAPANPAAPEPAQKKAPVDLLKLGSSLGEKDDIEVEVNIDAKGGKSQHRSFVNFLATDKVPDSIFGIPVVQDESQYTEKDLEFFKRNPKAAGFYDIGDEEEDQGDEDPTVREGWSAGDTAAQDAAAVAFIKQSEGAPDKVATKRGDGLVVDHGIRGRVHPKKPDGTYDFEGVALVEGKRPDESAIADTYDFWVTAQNRPALRKRFAATWEDQTPELYNLKQSVMWHARGPETKVDGWAREEAAVKNRDYEYLKSQGYRDPKHVTMMDVAIHNLLDYSSDVSGDAGAAKRVIGEAMRTDPRLVAPSAVTNYIFGASAPAIRPRIQSGIAAMQRDEEFRKTREREAVLAAERQARIEREDTLVKEGKGARFSKKQHRFPSGFYKAYGVTEETIKKLNPGYSPTKVKDGQFIRIKEDK